MLWGKLGFQGSGTDPDIQYDEASEDFVVVSESRGRGQFSFFVIDLETRYLLFEERPPEIKRNSFAGAFRQLLRETTSPYVFDVEFVSDTAEFMEWVNSVERVSRFFVSIRRPNPNWDNRPEALRDLMEESNAGTLTVEAKAPQNGAGLDVPGSDLVAFSDHAGEGYGTVRSTGMTPQGGTTYFDSERRIRTAEITVDPRDSDRSIVDRMIDAFRSMLP